jgi:hypothetical protein
VSLLQKQKELEDAPDSFLQQLLQQGNPQYPGWLVAAVADQRADFRQRHKNAEALRQAEQPTMVQNVSTKLGGIPDADPNQMGDPSLATGIAGGMAVAGGGVIPKYRTSGLVGDDDDDDLEIMLPSGEVIKRSDISDYRGVSDRYEEIMRELESDDRGLPGEIARNREPYSVDEMKRVASAIASVPIGMIKHAMAPTDESGLYVAEADDESPEDSIQGSAPFSADIVQEVLENPSMTPEEMQDVMRGRRDITGEEITDDTGTGSSQDFIDAWLADREAGRAAARGRFERVLGAGEQVIDDYAKARETDEDDRAIYRRERRDLNLALSQARRVADERGENAEERQEIYDNLVGELQSQDRQRRSSRRRRQQVQATRARGVGLGSLGDSSGRERMAKFIDDMRDEEIEYENQLRTDTREDAARILENLTNLQDYEEKTGTDLDDAILANSRGKTTLLGDLLDTDEKLEQELTEMSLNLYGKALSPSASLDAVDARAASAEAAARSARTVQEFERYMFKPESWEDTMNFFDTRLQLLDQDPRLDNDPARKARIEENLRTLFNDMANMNVRSLMDQTRTGVQGQTQLTAETLTYLQSGSPTGADVGR